MIKPYVSKLPASSCVLGTVVWMDANHANGLPCRVVHPRDPEPPCSHAGWTEIVTSYRQLWVHAKFRGTWINGKLYIPGTQLQVVQGASVRL